MNLWLWSWRCSGRYRNIIKLTFSNIKSPAKWHLKSIRATCPRWELSRILGSYILMELVKESLFLSAYQAATVLPRLFIPSSLCERRQYWPWGSCGPALPRVVDLLLVLVTAASAGLLMENMLWKWSNGCLLVRVVPKHCFGGAVKSESLRGINKIFMMRIISFQHLFHFPAVCSS